LPVIYLTPSLAELEGRIAPESERLGLGLVQATADWHGTKSRHSLELLESATNLAITHELFYRFDQRHLDVIKKHRYCIISDEELSFISAFNLTPEDHKLLIGTKLISIDDQSGQVTFNADVSSEGGRYNDVKAKADLGMLFAAKRSSKFMVTVLPPKLILAAERFIVLTYGYEGSLMHTFLKTQNITSSAFTEAKLRSTNAEAISKLKNRIQFIDTPASIALRNMQGFTMTVSAWENAKPATRKLVSSCIYGLVRSADLLKQDLFYTMPASQCLTKLGFDTSRVGKDAVSNKPEDAGTANFVSCNARATNIFENKKIAVHAFDLRPQVSVKAYLQDHEQRVQDDIYARNMLIQWLWRGCVRKDSAEVMKVCILSARMDKIFKDWLNSD
jgi:hypothetical protein